MAVKFVLDQLADKINRTLDSSGACIVAEEELAVIWDHNDELSDVQRLMHVVNFAFVYGFRVQVHDGLVYSLVRG